MMDSTFLATALTLWKDSGVSRSHLIKSANSKTIKIIESYRLKLKIKNPSLNKREIKATKKKINCSKIISTNGGNLWVKMRILTRMSI